MARSGDTLKTLVFLALLVVGGLVGYTWYETDQLGLWPKYTEHEMEVRGWEKEVRQNKRRIDKLHNRLQMGGRGTPRDSIGEEIAELEERNLYLDKLIRKYKAK